MDVHLYIQNGQTVYEPVALDSVTWETKRKGEAGKCSFTLLPDSRLKIEEGNAIRVDVGGQPVFFGFIFEFSAHFSIFIPMEQRRSDAGDGLRSAPLPQK